MAWNRLGLFEVLRLDGLRLPKFKANGQQSAWGFSHLLVFVARVLARGWFPRRHNLSLSLGLLIINALNIADMVESGPTVYIIEHFEQEFSDWTFSEYTHMLLCLGNMYATCEVANNLLILTNFRFLDDLGHQRLDEDDLDTRKNFELFLQIRAKLGSKCLLTRLSLTEVTAKTAPDCQDLKDDSQQVCEMLRSQISPSLDNICFMDMRAEKVLSPEDSPQLKFIVFGGILGDHPPQDRAGDFRATFKEIRQLGTVQMTTDTALFVSHQILEGKKPIDTLKFVDDPQIPMHDDVKRYLDIKLPLKSLA